ncbi:putative membrane protein [Jatrophihabitans endophyticus]|uniref:Putative membrane protein n=1 Tax=Jatrophihabitans endophyticus TaxID=1206085 RepID=A0A1M5KKN4_9ACTN|nr:DUF202 domain-containing protein [Jatrophihabitans endophyticus]SHG53316.1 putative membrane protein [Jatrophihabitans endophyticus]
MPRRPADGNGTEPDPRFLLANERTFLAWIRTALAVLAAAVGVVHFVPGTHLTALRTVLAVGLAILGAVLAIGVHARHRAVERALRAGEPLPRSRLVALLSVVVAVSGVLVVVLVLAN